MPSPPAPPAAAPPPPNRLPLPPPPPPESPPRGVFVFDLHNVIQTREPGHNVLWQVVTECEASALGKNENTSFPWLYKRYPPVNKTYLAYACELLRRANYRIILLSFCHRQQQDRSLVLLAEHHVDYLFDELWFCTARTWNEFVECPPRDIHFQATALLRPKPREGAKVPCAHRTESERIAGDCEFNPFRERLLHARR